MNPAAGFFFAVLTLQLVFTGLLIWLVGRRFPRRLPLYRFLAPAAVPTFLFCLIIFAILSFNPNHDDVPFVQLFLAYAVLWLFGVVWASMIARWTRR